jgi:NAD(P)-dependent dehydrogenase (short-subunit alcohol dehydrogenase family)
MAWLPAFRDRSVLVTGASSGIGRATAVAFAAAGAHVALAARRRELLEQVAAEIASHGGQALVVPTDVGDRDAVGACFDEVLAAHGRIDVVVNNAGLLIPGAVAALRADDLEAMLRVNLFGALFVMQEGLARMRDQHDGVIVNVASLAGRRGMSPLGGYCATKFGLVGLTEAVRTELHGSGVHVGLVLPGVVDTPMVSSAAQDPEFLDLWPAALSMPPSWVVWAIFAAVRFRLVEVSVPPGAATLEKLAALAPGVADRIVEWAKQTSHWMATASRRNGA